MLVLTIRTDNPQAEIGLFKGSNKLAYEVWEAHRALAETLHSKIDEVLTGQKLTLKDVGGLVVFKGPGSFTGLRIGLSVSNALASSLGVPIVGIVGEESWLEKGLEAIQNGQNDEIIMPEYGSPAYVTIPS